MHNFFIYLALLQGVAHGVSYLGSSAVVNGTHSLRACNDVKPWGRYGARYGNPYANDGYGNTTLPGLAWVNGWYQGSVGTSSLVVDNGNKPVTYAFWTSTGGRAVYASSAGCAYHMLAPTWLSIGGSVNFNLDAYGGEQAACGYATHQRTALVIHPTTYALYATSPKYIDAYPLSLFQTLFRALLSQPAFCLPLRRGSS